MRCENCGAELVGAAINLAITKGFKTGKVPKIKIELKKTKNAKWCCRSRITAYIDAEFRKSI